MERRHDVGGKSVISMCIAVIGILMSFFINASWTTANEGKNMAIEAMRKVSYLEANINSIKEDLSEIKGLLKRASPNSGYLRKRDDE